jgi:HEAT repeat protein
MQNSKPYLIFLVTLCFGGVVAIQHQSIRRLGSDLAGLRQELASLETAPAAGEQPKPAPTVRMASSGDASLRRRLAALEQAVTQLTRGSEYLMERGQLPLAADKLEDLSRKVADFSAADRDRLQALRLLRRNGGLTDEIVQHAMNWLHSSTNANTRENVVQQLEGLTNAALRGPLLALASADASADVREQAVDNLRRFVNDSEVETQLWEIMRNDSSSDVRDQAMEALIEGPVTQTRLTALRERATNPNTSVDERTVAWRALREANQSAPEVSAALAELAHTTQDAHERARLFRVFDDAGDPAFVPPLVQALQDPNVLVRERAADALSDYNSDPNVQQWLRFVAENDVDAGVRREASRAVRN